MKTVTRTVLVALTLTIANLGVLQLGAPSSQAAPDPTTRTVTLICSKGWRGSAVGDYGGVSFGVSCNNGRGRERLTGVSSTAYSVRMGAESDAIAVDCFFTWDAPTVNESCATFGSSSTKGPRV